MTMTPGHGITSEDVEPYPLRRTIERGPEGGVCTMVLIAAPGVPAPSAWAVVQHHVSGWDCIATGDADPDALDGEALADLIAARFGDGVDRLPADQFGVTRPGGEMIHTRRTSGSADTYCGKPAPAPYVHIRRPGRCEQHCMECRTTYSAEHYGRLAMEEH